VRAGHAQEKNQGSNNSQQAHQTPTVPRFQTSLTPHFRALTAAPPHPISEKPGTKTPLTNKEAVRTLTTPHVSKPPTTRCPAARDAPSRHRSALLPCVIQDASARRYGKRKYSGVTKSNERTIQILPLQEEVASMTKPRSLLRSPARPFRGAQGCTSRPSGNPALVARHEHRTAHEQHRLQERGTQSAAQQGGVSHGYGKGGMQEMEWSGKVVD
jgi:hypothetical protein